MASSGNQRRNQRRRPQPVDERPLPPWGNLPLSELLVIVGVIFGLWGFASENVVMIVVGLALASIGGLEVSVREHLTGFRSHTTLLAAAAGFGVLLAARYLASASPVVSLVAGAVVGLGAFIGLRAAFRRASGGYTVRIGKFRG